MTRLLPAAVIVLFIVLAIDASSESRVLKKREDSETAGLEYPWSWLCSNSQFAALWPSCKNKTDETSTTTVATMASTSQGEENDDLWDEPNSSLGVSNFETTTTAASGDNSESSSDENARWCLLKNGTYLRLGYMFMNTACQLCQCSQTHAIRCATFQCMPTYCIDNSSPSPVHGQCCSQCAYEDNPSSCTFSNIKFPHGTMIKTVSNGLKCWCQSGNIECRKSTNSVFSGMDFWGKNSAVYVVVVIVLALILFGTLICCGCSLVYYYYYQRNQQMAQQAYEEYSNSGGWLPVTDEEYVPNGNAEEKQAEAEENQLNFAYPTGTSEEYVPPPYALYNGSYVTNETDKQ